MYASIIKTMCIALQRSSNCWQQLQSIACTVLIPELNDLPCHGKIDITVVVQHVLDCIRRIIAGVQRTMRFFVNMATKTVELARHVTGIFVLLCSYALPVAAIGMGTFTVLALYVTGFTTRVERLCKSLGTVKDYFTSSSKSTTPTGSNTRAPERQTRVSPKYKLSSVVQGIDADVIRVQLAQCRSRKQVIQLLEKPIVHNILCKPDSSGGPCVPVSHREGLLLSEWEEAIGARIAASLLLSKVHGTAADSTATEELREICAQASGHQSSGSRDDNSTSGSFDGCGLGFHRRLSGSTERSSEGGAVGSTCSSVQGSVASFTGPCRMSAGGTRIYMQHRMARSPFASACR